MINLILIDGTTVSRPLVRAWNKGGVSDDMNVGNCFNYKNDWAWFIVKPDAPIRWRQLMGFEFVLHDDDEWRITGLAINAFHAGGGIPLLDMKDVSYWFPLNSSSQTVTYIKRPGPPPPMLPPPHRAPEKQLSVEEYHLVRKLTDHFGRNKDYYNRVLLMGTDPTSIAIEMEGQPWGGQSMADHVDPTPLEVFGSYVAYPLAKQVAAVDDTVVVDLAAALNGNDPARRQWALDTLAAMSEAERQSVLERLPLASAKSERLNTMATRGVFAEGKLGHCNVSEEIDNTRFWKWEEHPIPIEAPDINPVTPIQPQPQQVTAAPTAFPQSLVNIVNPSPAPDPTGLGAALALLGTPNIFRDMSGREEVADLLKKLSDNSIAIAEAANRAREIQGKYGANLDKGSAPSGAAPAPQPPAPPPTKQQQQRAELDNDKKKLEAADEHLPPEQKKQVKNEVVKKWNQPKKVWTVSLTSEWAGETIKQPMEAMYVGELIYGAKGDTQVLNPIETDQIAVWDVETEKTPFAFRVVVANIVPFSGGFSVAVPGITVDGLALKETTYNVPLRAAASNLIGDLKGVVNNLKIDPNSTKLFFQGTGKIGKRDIEVTAKVNAAGELSADFGRDFEREATVEIVKLALKSTLKAAVKTTIGGETAIKGTFEILVPDRLRAKAGVMRHAGCSGDRGNAMDRAPEAAPVRDRHGDLRHRFSSAWKKGRARGAKMRGRELRRLPHRYCARVPRRKCAIVPFRARNSRGRCRMPTVCGAGLGAGWHDRDVAALNHSFNSQMSSKPLPGLVASFDYCNHRDYGSGL